MGMDNYKGINKFSPTKISNLVAWYDASQITGLSDGDPISQWDDLSGNDYHLLQANAAQRPLYKTDGSLALPYYIYFDGTDDFLRTNTYGPYPQPHTIIAMGRIRTKPVILSKYFYDGSTSPSSRHTLLLTTGAPQFAYMYADSIAGMNYIGPEIGQWGITNAVFNGSNCSLRDGKSIVLSQGTVLAQNSNRFTLGCANSMVYFTDMDILEIIFYNKVLLDIERFQVENYLAKKWGLKTFSLIAKDDFMRANSAISMGICLSNQIWTAGSYQDANNPTIGISSNMAYFPATPGTDSHAYIETGRSDCVITARFVFDGGGDSDKGIIFRRADGDNYFFLHTNSAVDQLKLSRCLAGVRSDIASVALTAAAGQVAFVRCYLYGNSIKCGMFVNTAPNAKEIDVTDATLTTATKHGLYNHSGNTAAFTYFGVDDYPVP
jgi:hypothetical protein